MPTENKRFQIRRGTAAQWTSSNPILASGEQGYETDTGRSKIGDGVTGWTALSYLESGTSQRVNATLAYTGTRLDTITYVDGTSRVFTYTGDTLTRVDFVRPGKTTIRKDITWTSGQVTAIAWSEV